MSPSERRERLRLEIETATMRYEWAVAEAKNSETTPALTKFIAESKEECRILVAKLKSLNRPTKRKTRSQKSL